MSERPRAAVLVSGGGSTAANLVELDRAGQLAASIAVVVAHRRDIGAVPRCEAIGVTVAVIDGAPGEDASNRLDDLLRAHQIDLVLLGGYLRRFRVGPWSGRALNIHPALLPNFGGKGMHGDRVHRAVLDAGAHESGCTVHLVDEEYDHGPTVLQRIVPVLAGDTVATLGERVRAAERIAYPEAIARWVEMRSASAGSATACSPRTCP